MIVIRRMIRNDCRNLPNDTEKKKLFSEKKNYDRVFWTRGMIAAGMAG